METRIIKKNFLTMDKVVGTRYFVQKKIWILPFWINIREFLFEDHAIKFKKEFMSIGVKEIN